MFTISQSKIKTWRRCRNAYHYRYIQKLKPKRIQRPLVFGNIVHRMIEAQAMGDDPRWVITDAHTKIKKVFSSEREEYLQIISDADLIMTHYFEYYKKDPLKPLAHKGLVVEREFNVELCKGINIKGKLDEVAKDRQNRVWLVEHKSHKEIPSEDVRFRDIQTVLYGWVLPDLGIKKFDGVLWNYIRTKPPTVPQLLKSGELSQAKIDTLPEIYLAEIKKHKLNPKNYKPILKDLEGAADKFFKRVYMPVNQKLTNQLLIETIVTAKEIQEKAEQDRTRNITRDCSWCEYESLCRAELLGHDAHFIRKKEYTQEETI